MKDWVDLGGNQQQVVSKLEQGSGIQLPKHYATAENKNEVQKKVKLIFIFIQLSQMQGAGRTKVILNKMFHYEHWRVHKHVLHIFLIKSIRCLSNKIISDTHRSRSLSYPLKKKHNNRPAKSAIPVWRKRSLTCYPSMKKTFINVFFFFLSHFRYLKF